MNASRARARVVTPEMRAALERDVADVLAERNARTVDVFGHPVTLTPMTRTGTPALSARRGAALVVRWSTGDRSGQGKAPARVAADLLAAVWQ